jgi:hypothetical protein
MFPRAAHFFATAYRDGPPDGGRAPVASLSINMALLTEGGPSSFVFQKLRLAREWYSRLFDIIHPPKNNLWKGQHA